MTKKSRPRAGSLAFYPRKKAKHHLARFKTAPEIAGENAKPINFIGYKAGMTHVLGKDMHEKGVTFGQDIVVPCTVIECPSITVFGIRAYEKTFEGLKAIGDVFAEKTDREILRKIKNFKKKSKKEKKEKKTKTVEEKKQKTINDLKNNIERIAEIRLLVHSNPKLTTIGKKRPDVFEIMLSGRKEKQLAFAEEKLGRQLSVKDYFEEKQFVDVKAVTKGFGMTGVIKRFGVKTLKSPKSKTERVVGSIGPWNPSTVMWTVARAGQHGYQTRTEYNRRILMIGENGNTINPDSGFKNYGDIRNTFILLSGSVPGAKKRAIALRHSIRKLPENRFKIESIDFIATKKEKQLHATEEETKTVKIEVKEEQKGAKKSVAEEIAEAVKGK